MLGQEEERVVQVEKEVHLLQKLTFSRLNTICYSYYYLLLHITGREDQSVVILRRKQVGNPKGFFDKNFDDYKEGFESRGESHLQKASLDSISDSFAFSLS